MEHSNAKDASQMSEQKSMTPEKEVVQWMQFNEDSRYINLGTTHGFRILSSIHDKPVEKDELRETGGAKFVLSTSNLVVYVRGHESCPSKELIVYDDDHNRESSKIVFKDKEIRGIRLTKKCLLVILENSSYLFSLNKSGDIYREPYLLKKFATASNPAGVGCLWISKDKDVVILPGKDKKTVQIYHSDNNKTTEFKLELEPFIISANLMVNVFAYADHDGKNIYIRSIATGEIMKELYRSSTKAQINWIAFTPTGLRVAVSSTSNTVHVYSLPKSWYKNGGCDGPEESKIVTESVANSDLENSEHMFSQSDLGQSMINPTFGFLNKNFFGKKGECSYLQIKVYDTHKICAFVDNKLVVLWASGRLLTLDYEHTGEVKENSSSIVAVELLSEKPYELMKN